ncbi:EAL domain-containing protein [Oceanimonas sp. NS1]|uniref:EAL domain-containing protein n=1 Tax=Oceanimonas sp. MB9 TaxID=2588453 RepID=UPI0013F5C7D4|nr:EAL domain-containing protein [Oceanimonas sp. MB9]MCT7653868.1 EAL domain-containing protein [Oceanimonas sp. NS1]NHH99849.1 putative cyclic-di-GMP phosphodiesterase YlaB [Oceanimonas sp. MB9]
MLQRAQDYIDNFTLYDLVQHRRFGAEYQPIVELSSGDIMGWEALARFYTPSGDTLRPDRVFEALHSDNLSLFSVEHQMKSLQIAQAPGQGDLFLNLDPHAFALFGRDPRNPLLELFADRDRLVVEIIENSDANDALYSASMSDALRGLGLKLALDDIGAPDSMLSFELLVDMDYLKLDRSWLKPGQSEQRQQLLLALCRFARSCGKPIVLEGVERQEDLEVARRLGVDYVQGFLYRSLFKTIKV